MRESRVTVRLIGLPTDSHSSFLRGPASGPAAIRAALGSDHSNLASESGLELGHDILIEDLGDLLLDETAADVAAIRSAAEQAARDGVTPLFLGGDHMVTNPIVSGLAAVHGPLYISIDLDGLDPAFAPGVSHHEPGGLSVRDILAVLHRVRGPIVGGDVVELNPSRDINGMTAVVAAKLMKELAALAERG